MLALDIEILSQYPGLSLLSFNFEHSTEHLSHILFKWYISLSNWSYIYTTKITNAPSMKQKHQIL